MGSWGGAYLDRVCTWCAALWIAPSFQATHLSCMILMGAIPPFSSSSSVATSTPSHFCLPRRIVVISTHIATFFRNYGPINLLVIEELFSILTHVGITILWRLQY